LAGQQCAGGWTRRRSPQFPNKPELLYSAAAFVLGATFLYYAARFVFRKSNTGARHLLIASIIYLPLVFALIVVHKK